MKIKNALYNMGLALNAAEDAFHKDEVPVGAVIVSEQGEILAQTFNLKETNHDACAHAEILAIQKASSQLKSWRLNNCSIFVTLEPCPMCMSAILQSRIKNLYFGAYDRKGGSLSLGYNFHKDDRLNHKFNIYGGLKHIECSRILSRFFKQKRQKHLK
jgi:tRNA(adenine34) deaminase